MVKYNAIGTHSEVCHWARLYGATGKSCRPRDPAGGVATSLTWGATASGAGGGGIATRSHAGFPSSFLLPPFQGEICCQLFLKLWAGLKDRKIHLERYD